MASKRTFVHDWSLKKKYLVQKFICNLELLAILLLQTYISLAYKSVLLRLYSNIDVETATNLLHSCNFIICLDILLYIKLHLPVPKHNYIAYRFAGIF